MMNEMFTSPSEPLIVIEGLAAIRARPALQLGLVESDRLCFLITRILHWACENDDWGGCGKSAVVTLLDDGAVCVATDAQPLSVTEDEYGRVPLTFAFTSVMTGPTSANGLSLVTAFSNRVVVEATNDGHTWQQEFAEDAAVSPARLIGSAQGRGTKITFWPKDEYFPKPRDGQALEEALSDFRTHHPAFSLSVCDEHALAGPWLHSE